jgi:hypothetical protein
MSSFTIEQIIEKYLDLREQIERINAETKAKLEPINKAMEGIESYLMATANTTGQTQFGTTAGTAFITTSNQCGVADWEAVKKYIEENKAWHLLNKAVNKTAVGEYVDQHQTPPPGVKWAAIKVIQVRKKSAGKNLKEEV